MLTTTISVETPSNEIKQLQQALAEFAHQRNWDQFHTPKNLAMALSGEVGELLKIFQWLTPEQSQQLSPEKKQQNAAKYPISKCYGSAKKYNELN
ncbi:nucleotide pyrophosphohydrolase [Photobacterium carnosum]|uniref:nucleotide pyrophosphohydrolase n=1 Tax=Photobacterium carnosum TaxID=2023717 RepID=UPI001C91FC47|nr:nucleotide pyrophosphohydrolase [Photobacterium carnosum]MBY3787387.1 nucleotide pyrophosphohydrolase [Photobacterium carnosum]MCD9532019.1 nucleotide pyrophosphohydrolase [Photobacterium carnosum]